MRYPSLAEVLDLHRRLIEQTGGASGLRDLGALESALAQPRMTFGGEDLLIQNHPFVNGNKRVGHAAMETFLILNGSELNATVDDAERVILSVADGTCSHEELVSWIRGHLIPVSPGGAA